MRRKTLAFTGLAWLECRHQDVRELERLGDEMKALFTEQMSGEPTASLTGDASDDTESEPHSSRV